MFSVVLFWQISPTCLLAASTGELHARIVVGRDGTQLLLHTFADVERLHKLVDGLLCHLGVGAGERLERLIGMGITLAAQDGLDGLVLRSMLSEERPSNLSS